MIYEFTPTQDLHGYSEPWPAGGGKNKLDDSIRAFNGGNIWLGGPTGNTGTSVTLPAGTYTFTVKSKSLSQVNIYARNSDENTAIEGFPKYGSTALMTSQSFTLEETTPIRFSTYNPNFTSADDIEFAIVESGSAFTSYAPYSNICPPEGYNIWDPTNDEMIQVYSGYVNANTRELYLRPVYDEYAGEELVGPWMSSLDPYEEDTTPTEGAFVIDFGGAMTSYEITPFMLQTLLDSLGIRQHFTNGAGLLNSLMDQAQGRVRSEEELLHLSRPLNVIAIGDQLPVGLTFKPISKDVLPGLPGKFIR